MSPGDFWELAEYSATAVVTLACVGEYVHDFTKWHRNDGSWWDLKGAKISTLVLVVALAFEIPIQLKLNAISAEKIAGLNKQANEAKRDLELLQRNTTPRLITLARNNFGEMLKGRPTGSFRIWYVTENEDTLNLAQSLAGYLMTAGWKGTMPVPIPDLPPVTQNEDTRFMRASGGMAGGNGIVLRCSKLSVWRDKESPIGSLMKCFEDAGVQVGIVTEDEYEWMQASKDVIGHSLAKDEVLIVVGTKY